jgi:hypothetical protein
MTVLVQYSHHKDVDKDSSSSGNEHHIGFNFKVSVDASLYGLVHQDSRHHPDDEDRHYRSQNLCK